tara:strand:+ start:190 stop:396 length:207 start_codon:yes stop_codon:yes gene_type:complete
MPNKSIQIKDKGTLTVINGELYFLETRTKQWEEFDIESFWEEHYTEDEKKYIKSELGFEPKIQEEDDE